VSGIPAISIEGLEKCYREGFFLRKSQVLFGLDFSVPQGQIFGFLGANGSGKTTTIKIALGLQAPDKGRIELLGLPSGDPRAKERIGFLPERPYFQGNLTANEFLDFHRGLFPRGKRSSRSNEELFEIVGLKGIGSHFLRGFSKGMLQRMGIAQCLVNDPDLLILDEPMSGLDPVGRKDVRNLIAELNRGGKTVFFSSHIISDVEALCSRIAFLERGRLKYAGEISELLGDRSQAFEILFRAGPDGDTGLAEFGGAQLVGGRHRLLVHGSSEARRAAEACWSRGGEVLAFGPVQVSLEEALFGKGGGK
jgi:ABC-2 type transport system ATP-binding protein